MDTHPESSPATSLKTGSNTVPEQPPGQHQGLLTVDWGTSSFRLSALNGAGELLQQRISARGVAQMPRAELWPFLRAEIASLPVELRHLPVILCGMVGSSIGLQEAPYLPCPTQPQQLAAALVPLDIAQVPLRAHIVPGLSARAANGDLEVMRGEESQIVGWLAQASPQEKQSSWLCLPGTHAKWVQIENGRVQHFHTALTGELFALLKQHSVLVQGEQQFELEAFDAGLAASEEVPQLSFNLFSTRSRVLDGRLPARHAAAYLSGLLIGSEINGQIGDGKNPPRVHLVGGHRLTDLYRRALTRKDIPSTLFDGADMALTGLRQLYLWSIARD